jgi:outer membrane protein assembly factor BamA
MVTLAARSWVLLAWILVFACAPIAVWCQGSAGAPAANPTPSAPALQTPPLSGPMNGSVPEWEGLPVRRISFEGVSAARLGPVAGQLAQTMGAPLTAENLKRSLRQLYATGLYDTVDVEGMREADGVALVFQGAPRIFIGTIGVDGATGPTMNVQLERASQLQAGTRLTPAKINRALDQMRTTLEENGYHQALIAQTVTPHPDQQLADIAFRVTSGPRARAGTVTVTGEAGMNVEEFRSHAHLRSGSYVDHDTINRALNGVLREYKNQGRLEAEVKLESASYDRGANAVNFRFSANRGPLVKVVVEGASIKPDRVKRLIPIYEEGSVDEDLLNEGNRRLRNYYQGLGYFDVKADHEQQSAGSNEVTIVYTVQLGPRRRVAKVSITGNHYFAGAGIGRCEHA